MEHWNGKDKGEVTMDTDESHVEEEEDEVVVGIFNKGHSAARTLAEAQLSGSSPVLSATTDLRSVSTGPARFNDVGDALEST